MRILVDSNALLWYANGDLQLTVLATQLLSDPANELLVSMASIWELGIKSGQKKLTLPKPYPAYMKEALSRMSAAVLPISLDDCFSYESLPFPLPKHRDPFDRMIITHAIREQLEVVGSDADFDAYGIIRIGNSCAI